MELHPAADRKPFGDDLEILRFVTLAERAQKTSLALRPISAWLSANPQRRASVSLTAT